MSESPESIIVSFPLGDTLVEVSFGLLNEYCTQSLKQGIIFAVCIGTCLTMLMLMWIMNFRKRKTPIFWLNQAVLLVFVIRSSLYLAYLLGPLGSLSFGFTGRLESHQHQNLQVSLAANGFQVILIAIIEVSLNYQLYTIFKSTGIKRLGMILCTITGILSLTTIGFYINANVDISRTFTDYVLHPERPPRTLDARLSNIPQVLFATMVMLVLVILMVKLVLAVRTRRYLGLKQFDSFQVLLVMSTQTLIVPSILTVISYVKPKPDLVLLTLSLLLVALNLPLSAMWALTANNNPDIVPSTISFVSSNMSDRTATTLSSGMFQKHSHDLEFGYEGKKVHSDLPHDIQEILNDSTSTINRRE